MTVVITAQPLNNYESCIHKTEIQIGPKKKDTTIPPPFSLTDLSFNKVALAFM
jgi:hypothetical protein